MCIRDRLLCELGFAALEQGYAAQQVQYPQSQHIESAGPEGKEVVGAGMKKVEHEIVDCQIVPHIQEIDIAVGGQNWQNRPQAGREYKKEEPRQ